MVLLVSPGANSRTPVARVKSLLRAAVPPVMATSTETAEELPLRATVRTTAPDASARVKRYVAAHEFMHVLGFRHHGGSGLVGIDPPSYYATSPLPGPGEWAALHAYFGGPPEPAPTLPLPRPACQDAVVCR